ncbi:hypothetical protein BFS86_13085 [Shewanella algae]|nr:hypothetical protein BFS86_13085 [Shewanella algae]
MTNDTCSHLFEISIVRESMIFKQKLGLRANDAYPFQEQIISNLLPVFFIPQPNSNILQRAFPD